MNTSLRRPANLAVIAGLCLSFVGFHLGRGAVPNPPTPEQEQQALQTLGALTADWLQLRAQNPEANALQLRDRFERWLQQHAAAFASLRGVLDAISSVNQRRIMLSPVAETPVPPGASPTLVQFISEENELFQAIASLRRNAVDFSAEQRRDMLQQWHDSNARWLESHRSVADSLSTETASASEDIEFAITIPEEASEAERDFWWEEAAIDEELLSLRAQYADAAPEKRRDAIQSWFDANAERLNAHEELRNKLSGN